MSKNDGSPTMIIPAGTEIQIDSHGQLSVRTPGNLVIQNSGHYGEIESVHGSIRIEANAEVEAVSVRCAETCYVQGSLTSWKVKAKTINLEEKAQARVVLQEAENIEIGKNAKMVGNFSSEKELFLLFSRFGQQLRSLPFYFDRKSTPTMELEGSTEGSSEPIAHGLRVAPLSNRVLDSVKELPDSLFFGLVLLEREAKSEVIGSASSRAMEELVKLLKARDLETLRHTHRTLFSRITDSNDDIRRAQELIGKFFAISGQEVAT
jgi:hypothetical protein